MRNFVAAGFAVLETVNPLSSPLAVDGQDRPP